MIWIAVLLVFPVVGAWFYHHQCLLRDRAHLMREAVRNRDFTFRLSVRGLFFGEKALQQALNDMGKDISRLLAKNEVESWQKLTRVLTHEIMNATTPIQSISQAYLSQPHIKGTAYEEGIQAIYDTSTSLAAFVDTYRTFTQLQEPVLKEVRLNAFISALTQLFPTLQWKIRIPESSCMEADANLLRQVFINLAKNASEAGARTLDIRCESRKNKLMLLISNDGAPIPAEIRKEIFIPFFTTKKTGSGIGLALSRQIMVMQGLNLKLADTPVQGFHVTFCIPLADSSF